MQEVLHDISQNQFEFQELFKAVWTFCTWFMTTLPNLDLIIGHIQRQIGLTYWHRESRCNNNALEKAKDVLIQVSV